MKLNKLFFALVLSLSSTAYAASDEPNVEVTVMPDEICTSNHCFPNYRYTVTALDNRVHIKRVVVNRGNCGNDTVGKRGNINLAYGQEWEFTTVTNDTYTKCKPRELFVETNTGEWVFDF